MYQIFSTRSDSNLSRVPTLLKEYKTKPTLSKISLYAYLWCISPCEHTAFQPLYPIPKSIYRASIIPSFNKFQFLFSIIGPLTHSRRMLGILPLVVYFSSAKDKDEVYSVLLVAAVWGFNFFNYGLWLFVNTSVQTAFVPWPVEAHLEINFSHDNPRTRRDGEGPLKLRSNLLIMLGI